METFPFDQLVQRKCQACEGGIPAYSTADAIAQLKQLPGWSLSNDGKRIRKEWKLKNFMAAMNFFNHVATIAELNDHHPDLHLAGYRNVSIELWTHAIDGLSENDFILAAQIDQLPVKLLNG